MDLSFNNKVMIIPARIPNTGPPMIGNVCPRNQHGTAMTRQSKMPFQLFVIKFIEIPLSSEINKLFSYNSAYDNTKL